MAVSKKKKKKYIGLLILILLCAVLFAGYAVLSQKMADDEAAESTTAASLENLFELENTDILQVSYRVEDQTLTFKRDSSEDEWYSTEDESLPVDQSAIGSVVSTACAVTINQVIASDLENKAAYGLEEPACEVRMTDADGREYVLYIGDTTGSTTDRRYAYVEGEERILSISSTIVSKLNTDLQSLLSVEEYPSFEEDAMTHIYYEDANQTMELFNDPEDLTEAEAIGTTTWYYMEDGVYLPLNQSHSTELLPAITGITFEACVTYHADDEEMEGYGLAEPAAQLTVDYTVTESDQVETETTNDSGSRYETVTTTSEESVTVNIGNKCEGEEFYYATLNDGRTVYKLDAETVELFTENVLSDYCLSYYPTLCNFDGIEEIYVAYEGKTLEISVTQTKETDEEGNETTVYSCKLNGSDFEEDEARTIFSSLIRVTADHIIPDEDIKTDGEAVFSCTYYTSYDKKPEITFEISEYDATYYQLSLNGKAKYAITKQEFNTLVSSLEEYLE